MLKEKEVAIAVEIALEYRVKCKVCSYNSSATPAMHGKEFYCPGCGTLLVAIVPAEK